MARGARQDDIGRMQERAWGYFGWPGSSSVKAVGEVTYVVGWRSDQMTRLDWDVFIGGSDSWVVDDVPKKVVNGKEVDGTPITTTHEDGEEDQTEASGELLDLIGWSENNVRAVDTNIFVGGQGNYIQEGNKWRVVSVVENDRKKTLDEADENIPFRWPHPGDPKKPYSPLFSVLELLDELDWLTRQGRTQSKQRVLTSGAWFIADGFQGPNGTDFWEMFNTAQSAKMQDTDDMSGLRFQGPHELIKDGANFIKPDHDYDAVLDRKVQACIQRLAYGLPIPPEILLGLQAQSRATAFQVEENAYRAHIEPPALLVAQVAQDALKTILDRDDIEVVPNPARLLARRQSVQDVKDAYDRNEVTGKYMREVLGIPDDAAPIAEEDLDPVVKTALDMAVNAPSLAQVPGLPDLVAQIRAITDGTPYVPAAKPEVAPAPTDPANDAADEPIAAAGSIPNLSDLLAQIDQSLSYELAGFTVAVTDRARQRLGAVARSNELIRTDPTFKGLKSGELAHKLGSDGLAAAGVDVPAQIAEPIDAATRWWVARIGQAWGQAATLVPGWTGQGDWVEESVSKLADSLQTHIIDTLGLTDPGPLDAGAIRDVLDAAAGGSTYGVR